MHSPQQSIEFLAASSSSDESPHQTKMSTFKHRAQPQTLTTALDEEIDWLINHGGETRPHSREKLSESAYTSMFSVEYGRSFRQREKQRDVRSRYLDFTACAVVKDHTPKAQQGAAHLVDVKGHGNGSIGAALGFVDFENLVFAHLM